jgi:hypothetical protein
VHHDLVGRGCTSCTNRHLPQALDDINYVLTNKAATVVKARTASRTGIEPFDHIVIFKAQYSFL